jgi:hypothetical protein
MQTAFQVAEENRHGLDAALVGQVFQAGFLNNLRRGAVLAVQLGLEIQFLQLGIGKYKEILEGRHRNSWVELGGTVPPATYIIGRRSKGSAIAIFYGVYRGRGVRPAGGILIDSGTPAPRRAVKLLPEKQK